MPKYDFTCIPCDTTVELNFGFDDTHRPLCEKCGEFLSKAWTPPAIHLKGGGWGGQ
jgi:putative FmdB family regulatory protein